MTRKANEVQAVESIHSRNQNTSFPDFDRFPDAIQQTGRSETDVIPFSLFLRNFQVQHVSKTKGIENAQPIHLVDLFGTILGAASQAGPALTFDNEVSNSRPQAVRF